MKCNPIPHFAALMLSLIAGSANAGDPIVLTASQMDGVTAGADGTALSAAGALGDLAAQTFTLTLGAADSAHQGALAIGLSSASAASLLSPAAATSVSSALARSP